MKKCVSYIRVSTQKQGASGLGLEAQQQAVANFMSDGSWKLVGEFVEVETGKGANALETRPQLRSALAAAKKSKATLLIAKLDRLARNVHFVSGLLESGVDFLCADMPQANKVMLQMYSVIAEWERDQISLRTKAALTAAKTRGVRLGTPANLVPNIRQRQAAADAFANKLAGVVSGMRARGMTQQEMTDELNTLGIGAPKGGRWTLIQLQRLLKRLATRKEPREC